jgi:hypothetical protein
MNRKYFAHNLRKLRTYSSKLSIVLLLLCLSILFSSYEITYRNTSNPNIYLNLDFGNATVSPRGVGTRYFFSEDGTASGNTIIDDQTLIDTSINGDVYKCDLYHEAWRVKPIIATGYQTGSGVILNSETSGISTAENRNGRVGAYWVQCADISTNAAVATNLKQRCERSFNVPIKLGDTLYYGLSFKLDAKTWTFPNSWLNLAQIREQSVPGTRLSNFLLQVDTYNNLIGYYSGGATVGGKAGSFSIGNLTAGIWYDVIMGFRYEPLDATKGFISVSFKKATDTNYITRKVYTTFGYEESYNLSHSGTLFSVPWGVYRSSTNAFTSKVYFDNLRVAKDSIDVRPDIVPIINELPVLKAGNPISVRYNRSNSKAIIIQNKTVSNQDFKFTLNDLQGRKILDKKLSFLTADNAVNVRGLSNGTYLWTLKTKDAGYCGKALIN